MSMEVEHARSDAHPHVMEVVHRPRDLHELSMTVEKPSG